MEDNEAMTTDEKSEVEEKVAVALDENYDKHDLVARAHSGDIAEDSEDEAMEEDDAEMVDAEKVDTEVGNLEQAWQMFDLSQKTSFLSNYSRFLGFLDNLETLELSERLP